jgi:hypothetical protein
MRVHGDKRTLGEVWDEVDERRHDMNDTQQLLSLFGDSVALHLSAGKLWWKLDRADDTHIKLRGADGMKISLWCGGISFMLQDNQPDKIKFEVHGEYPPDTYLAPEDKPQINVSYSKGAKAVAKDIERRFLSKYVPLYYEKLEIQQGIERGRAARERLLGTLQQVLDWEEVRDKDGHLERLQTGWHSGLFYWGKANAHYTTSLKPESERRWEVDIELKKLTVDQALRIARLLNEPTPPEQLSFL